MESALESIGNEWARQDRKRRREATALPPEGSAAGTLASSESTESSEPPEDLNSALTSPAVQKRLHESVRCMVREGNDRKLNSGAAFVARSVYAMFMTVQAVHPLPYGCQWAGLLYVCYYAVSNEFSGGPPALHHGEGLVVREMRTLTRHMGMGQCEGGSDETLMKDARKWERSSDAELAGEMLSAWSVVSDVPRVRLAVESLLWPCQRAHLLFDSASQR